MAAAETIELLGGRRDGQVMQVPDGTPEIHSAEPIQHQISSWSEAWTPSPTIRTVRYLRTKQFNQGRRIYRLEGLDHVR